MMNFDEGEKRPSRKGLRSEAHIAISSRFKQAFEAMQAERGHGAKAQFCRKYNINNNQLNALLKHPDTRTLPPYYVACLCMDFGVSADWILMNTGEMVPDTK